MDPNNLAVNSVTIPYLASSNAGDERFCAALPRMLDGVRLDGANDCQYDMKAIILTNLDLISAGIVQASTTNDGGAYEYA